MAGDLLAAMRRELEALESWPAAAVALAGGEPVALAYVRGDGGALGHLGGDGGSLPPGGLRRLRRGGPHAGRGLGGAFRGLGGGLDQRSLTGPRGASRVRPRGSLGGRAARLGQHRELESVGEADGHRRQGPGSRYHHRQKISSPGSIPFAARNALSMWSSRRPEQLPGPARWRIEPACGRGGRPRRGAAEQRKLQYLATPEEHPELLVEHLVAGDHEVALADGRVAADSMWNAAGRRRLREAVGGGAVHRDVGGDAAVSLDAEQVGAGQGSTAPGADRAAASPGLLRKPASVSAAGESSRRTKKFAVLDPRSTSPMAEINSSWSWSRRSAPGVPLAKEKDSVPLARELVKALWWIETKRSAGQLLAALVRLESDTDVSVVRVIMTSHSPPPEVSAVSASRRSRRRRATSRLSSFSTMPLPMAPGSVPPWPASMKIRRGRCQRPDRARARVEVDGRGGGRPEGEGGAEEAKGGGGDSGGERHDGLKVHRTGPLRRRWV